MCISKLGQILLRQNFRAILKMPKSPITTALSAILPDFFKYYFPVNTAFLKNAPVRQNFRVKIIYFIL